MRRLFILTAVAVAANVSSAQSTFDNIVDAIVSSNPALNAAGLNASADRIEQSDANTLSNPSVDFARVWGRHGIGNKLQLDVAQEFDWPGLYGARRRAADASLSAAEMNNRAASLQMAMDVRGLLLELVYVRRQLAELTVLKENFSKLSDAIDKGVRGGELTIIDQRKMQIENYEIDNQIAGVMAREQQIMAELQGLSGTELDLSGITAYPMQECLSLQEYIDRAASDPEAEARRLAAESESENLRVARLGHFPGFSLGYQHQAEMGDRFNGFTVGVKLPFFENRHARAAAAKRRDAAELEAKSAVDSRIAEIEGAFAQLEIQRGRIDAYNRTFGDNLYLSLLLKAYQGGEMSVIEYLSEIHYYHQTILTYLEAEYCYNQALVTLNRR